MRGRFVLLALVVTCGMAKGARADEVEVVSTIGGAATCDPQTIGQIPSTEACTAMGGLWRARTRSCECPEPAVATVDPADRTLYSASEVSSLASRAAASLGVSIFILTVGPKMRVLERLRVEPKVPPEVKAGPVAAMVVVDEKTWSQAKVGGPLAIERPGVAFLPRRKGEPLSLKALDEARSRLLSVTGAAAVDLTSVLGR